MSQYQAQVAECERVNMSSILKTIGEENFTNIEAGFHRCENAPAFEDFAVVCKWHGLTLEQAAAWYIKLAKL